ncbi:hypothetical protein QC823_12685 [Halomonas vilamensis]|uniref:Tetratricopeptide repeat protein n=1 Tax=Vreelandella vilamensis TaxID=531309 RepID=A0ABU1H6A9_9GAMM|nr:hypothetical protein [Halomonas vilamensis]MDR5899843.1 hypothetical protein [Halomonas vilamensis]
MMNRAHACLFAILLLCSASVGASPALPQDVITDLNAVEERLEAQQYDAVIERALAQAQFFAGGNTTDRFASALYRQLAASALSSVERYAAAADQLAAARPSINDADTVKRWLLQEAKLRRAAGQRQSAVDLLSRWVNAHESESKLDTEAERWRLVRWLAQDKQWQAAAERLEGINESVKSDEQRELALAVYVNAGQPERALDGLLTTLGETPAPSQWRRASRLAQRAGKLKVAAALWDTAWQLGIFTTADDFWQLIALHRLAGTPARAAEYLEAALASGRVIYSEMALRLVAQSWLQARDIDQALASQHALAQLTRAADEWRLLGQHAFAWGRNEIAVTSFERAVALGDDKAQQWLASLRLPSSG